MHLVIFSSAYAPEYIGSAVYVADFARELVRRGHAATVVTAYPHYPEWDRSRVRHTFTSSIEDGVRVIRVPHTVPKVANARGRLFLEATYGLASAGALARVGTFDAAIGSIPLLSGGLAACLAGTLRGRPIGLVVRDLVSAAAMYGQVPGSNARIAGAVRRVERLMMPQAARVAVIARGFEGPVRSLGAREVDFLPNYRTVAEPALERNEARRRFGMSEGSLTALYSGAIGYKQGIDCLIDAARTSPQVHFLVVGEGSQRPVFQEAIAASGLANIRWAPLVPDEDYADLLNAADIFLMPQGETGIDMSVPGKLTSYLAMAKPIVAAASPHSETARVIHEAGAGVVVAPKDGIAIGAALNQLVDDEGRRKAFATSARRYAEEYLDRQRGLDRCVEWAVALAERRTPSL